jgi:hypothetical protein
MIRPPVPLGEIGMLGGSPRTTSLATAYFHILILSPGRSGSGRERICQSAPEVGETTAGIAYVATLPDSAALRVSFAIRGTAVAYLLVIGAAAAQPRSRFPCQPGTVCPPAAQVGTAEGSRLPHGTPIESD